MSTGTDRARRGFGALQWKNADDYPWAAPLAAAGAVGALAMAFFGLPPVDVHGPLHYRGIMDPLCGMTRAVRHLARLEIGRALRYNPAVLVLAFAGVVAIGRWVHGRYTGRWIGLRLERRWYTFAAAGVLVVALAVRQQANVDILV